MTFSISTNFEMYSATRVEPPLRHWRCSRCFSPRTLCFERAARGHSRRGGRPPGSDWSTFFGFDAGELHRVRAERHLPANLAIFCSQNDPIVCVRTIGILPEHMDPFLFFRCRRDRMSRKPCTPTSASADPTTGTRQSFFGFGSRGDAVATLVNVPMLEAIVPPARAPQQPRARSLLAPPFRPTGRADWYPVASVLAQRCCLYGAPPPPLPHLGGWALLRLRCRRVRTLLAGVAGGAAAALATSARRDPTDSAACAAVVVWRRPRVVLCPPFLPTGTFRSTTICPRRLASRWTGVRPPSGVRQQLHGGGAACRAARFFCHFWNFRPKIGKIFFGLRRFAQ